MMCMLWERVPFAWIAAGGGLLLASTLPAQVPAAREPVNGPAVSAQARASRVDVSYENGLLTIEARGAPLIEVLRAVSERTGADLEAQAELVAPIPGTLGPGPAREVLASLLSEAHVNYALMASDEDPNALASVSVFARTNSGTVEGTAISFSRAQQAAAAAAPAATEIAQADTGPAAEKKGQPRRIHRRR